MVGGDPAGAPPHQWGGVCVEVQSLAGGGWKDGRKEATKEQSRVPRPIIILARYDNIIS